jgi:hypothetical protein
VLNFFHLVLCDVFQSKEFHSRTFRDIFKHGRCESAIHIWCGLVFTCVSVKHDINRLSHKENCDVESHFFESKQTKSHLVFLMITLSWNSFVSKLCFFFGCKLCNSVVITRSLQNKTAYTTISKITDF